MNNHESASKLLITKSLIAWIMWFLITMFYAYQYVLRVLPGVMMGGLAGRFHVGPLEIGHFSGIYYMGYTIAHIPIALLIDKIGAKKIIPICIIITFAGLLPLIYLEGWIYSVVGRCVTGAASSASVFGLFKIISIGFGEKKFNRMVGITVTIGLLGGIYGGAPIGSFVDKFGLELVIKILSLFGSVLAVVTYFAIPKSMDRVASTSSSVWNDLKVVLLNPRVLFLGFLGGLMVGPLEGFADAWGPGFLESLYGMSPNDAKFTVSSIFFGMCFGCPMIAYISEKMESSYLLTLISGAGMLAGLVIVYSGICSNPIVLYIALFVVGFFCGYQTLILGKTRHFAPLELSTMTSSVANMLIMVFGYVFHSVIGFIVYKMSPSEAGSSMNDVKAMIYGLSTIPAALLLAMIGLVVILLFRKRLGY